MEREQEKFLKRDRLNSEKIPAEDLFLPKKREAYKYKNFNTSHFNTLYDTRMIGLDALFLLLFPVLYSPLLLYLFFTPYTLPYFGCFSLLLFLQQTSIQLLVFSCLLSFKCFEIQGKERDGRPKEGSQALIKAMRESRKRGREKIKLEVM